MPKDNSFSDHEMTVLPFEDKVGHLTPPQHFIEVCQATLEYFAINKEIIHEHLHEMMLEHYTVQMIFAYMRKFHMDM
jgi:hypothetical protein